MPPEIPSEAHIRDFLATRMSELPTLVTNLAAAKRSLQSRLNAFLAITEEQGGPTPAARFPNLSPSDYVWVPVCVEWRTTVRAAFANEAIWQHRPILPMRCTLSKQHSRRVEDLQLRLLPLLDTVSESAALSQFAWASFDTIEFALRDKPSDPRALVDFVSATSARHGFSGCVLYGESLAGHIFPYPYTLALATHNPFRAALKRRQLEIVKRSANNGTNAMRRHVKDELWSWHDLDFRTMRDRHPSVLEAMAAEADGRGHHAKANLDGSAGRPMSSFCPFRILRMQARIEHRSSSGRSRRGSIYSVYSNSGILL